VNANEEYLRDRIRELERERDDLERQNMQLRETVRALLEPTRPRFETMAGRLGGNE
jgi:hypothetical protein